MSTFSPCIKLCSTGWGYALQTESVQYRLGVCSTGWDTSEVQAEDVQYTAEMHPNYRPRMCSTGCGKLFVLHPSGCTAQHHLVLWVYLSLYCTLSTCTATVTLQQQITNYAGYCCMLWQIEVLLLLPGIWWFVLKMVIMTVAVYSHFQSWLL